MPREPVRLTVSAVRQAIYRESGRPSSGAGSLAGRLFHRTVECAFTETAPAFWRSSLNADLAPDIWASRLYDLALGSEITRARAALMDCGEDALVVWKALSAFSGWFCGLVAEASARAVLQYDAIREMWIGADHMFAAEVELAATFREPGWSQDVIVSGRADQLLRLEPDRWCVIEFKLGSGHREADVAQVCLYHELLGGAGAASLVNFTGAGEASSVVLERESIQRERAVLVRLIGALAGVVGGAKAGSERKRDWPKPARKADLETGQLLVRTLAEFNADSKLVGEPLVGPTFVRYVLAPERGVSAAKVESQGANLQMRLQLENEPMIGRAGGNIVVDMQRSDREYVAFGSVVPMGGKGRRNLSSSKVLAGVDLYGEVHFVDLASHSPHILVGGVPGSGKSEWLRCAVASLIVSNSVANLRLVIIDPKKNAFNGLAGSPYLWRPTALVDSPEGAALPILEEMVSEMVRRYDLFKKVHADNLAQYCEKSRTALPRIVCVVDEFAELLMSGKKAVRDEIEAKFIRIAQLGRAAGVHLILATQRPGRQVISGMLKANVPAKVALRVANGTESRVMLDQGGAQFLLGHGDLLLHTGGGDPVRLQSAWISEADRMALLGVRGARLAKIAGQSPHNPGPKT